MYFEFQNYFESFLALKFVPQDKQFLLCLLN